MDKFTISTSNIVVNQENKVLMVKEGKEHVYGKWDFPGGSLKEGEEPEKGVIRETIEETGFKTSPEYLVGVFLEESERTGKTCLSLLYKSKIVGKESKSAEEGEIIEHKFFDLSEFPELELRKPNRHKMLADYLKGEEYSKNMLKDTRRMD